MLSFLFWSSELTFSFTFTHQNFIIYFLALPPVLLEHLQQNLSFLLNFLTLAIPRDLGDTRSSKLRNCFYSIAVWFQYLSDHFLFIIV